MILFIFYSALAFSACIISMIIFSCIYDFFENEYLNKGKMIDIEFAPLMTILGLIFLTIIPLVVVFKLDAILGGLS